MELQGLEQDGFIIMGKVMLSSGSGQQIMFHNNDNIIMYDAYDSNSNTYTAGQAVNVSQDSVFSFYHNGTSLIKRQYGAQFDTDVTSGTYTPAAAYLNAIGYNPFDGKIYSLIIANYTSALDVQRLEGYICHRYGAKHYSLPTIPIGMYHHEYLYRT